MSIKPDDVERLLDGSQQVIYRKRIFKEDIGKIYLYETGSVKKVVGEVTVLKVLSGSVSDIWDQTNIVSGITYTEYVSYFAHATLAYAIMVGHPIRYEVPRLLSYYNWGFAPKTYCYVRDPIYQKKKVGAIIDRTGERFRDIVITKELGHNKVMGKCLLCGKEREFNKGALVKGHIMNCGCRGNNNIKHREGQTFGNFRIVRELGKGKVIARCLLCGQEKEYDKQKIVDGRIKNDGCVKLPVPVLRNYEGKTIGNFLVLKELGKGKIRAKCLLCGKEKEFIKYNLVHGIIQSCGCAQHKRKKKEKS